MCCFYVFPGDFNKLQYLFASTAWHIHIGILPKVVPEKRLNADGLCHVVGFLVRQYLHGKCVQTFPFTSTSQTSLISSTCDFSIRNIGEGR